MQQQQRRKVVLAVVTAISLISLSQSSHAALISLGLGVNLNIGTADPANAVALGEASFADVLGVSIGRRAGAGTDGDASIYIGANAGMNALGSFNTAIGSYTANALNGTANSIFGTGNDGCLTNISNPFNFSGCGSSPLVNGNSNTLLGNSINVEVIGDRNLSAGTNTGAVRGSDNISFGTNAGPGFKLGDLYLSNNFNNGFADPISASETISIGNIAQAATSGSIAIGSGSTVRGDINAQFGEVNGNSIAIGADATVVGLNGRSSIAIGLSSSAENTINGIAFGPFSRVTANGAVALGSESVASVANTISVGNDTLKREILNVAAGTTDTSAVNLSQVRSLIGAIQLPSVPLQPSGPASIDGLVIEETRTAIGINASSQTGSNSVALGNGSVANGNFEVSVGDVDSGLKRKLTNLLDGSSASDAATVGQVNNLLNTFAQNLPIIYPSLVNPTPEAIVIPFEFDPVYVDESGNTNLSNVATSGANNTTIGSNAGADNTGNGNTFIGNNASSTSGNSSDSVAIGNGAKAGTNSVAIGAGSVAEDNTVSVGSAGNERQVKNVAAGTAGTDAVNVQQLADGLNSVTQSSSDNYRALDSKLDRSISSVRKELKEIGRRAYGGTALALAIGNHSDMQPGRAQIQVGVGSFNGESAIALSTSMSADNGTVVSLGGGVTTQGDVGVRAGISFSWDPEWTK